MVPGAFGLVSTMVHPSWVKLPRDQIRSRFIVGSWRFCEPLVVCCLFVLIRRPTQGSVTSRQQALMTRPSLHPPSSKHCPHPPSSPNTERCTKWPTMKSDFQLDKAHQMLMYSTGDMLAQHSRHAEWDGSLNSHERSEFWSEILGSEWNQRHLRSLEGGSLLSHSRP